MILNLTQHLATPEQIAAGVVDLPAAQRAELVAALTVNDLPTWAELSARAEFVAELACQNGLGGDNADDPHPQQAMIGGAGPLMRLLIAALAERGIKALESFSRRESIDAIQPDGTVRKLRFSDTSAGGLHSRRLKHCACPCHVGRSIERFCSVSGDRHDQRQRNWPG